MDTETLASDRTRINWRVDLGDRETLEKAAEADGRTLSGWLNQYGMPAMLAITVNQRRRPRPKEKP